MEGDEDNEKYKGVPAGSCFSDLFPLPSSGFYGDAAMRENLKAARKAKGMTQQQTADELGMSLIGYQQIERGIRIGKIETWDKLEDMFGIHQRVLRENK